ncbi:TPA: baseplate J/gp47 family protein [Clostridium botulinum]|uniref:baseplate J/gp47 family protein n=1 Tax=Clostridium botulinum TaxID=1491 RepID=UPI0008FCCD2C|nr:baseplate J/gp47 family protein [Clostridium botulinum]APC79927.1 baseplate J-like family protein [Clostridium botulinum]MCS4449356.1 baseplate J/gp47 family protein [Clostridium botulinum]MCS4459166.1 baseplate J/gp47 family protein [Clostridium botulinum]MCS4463301.1 baseplate J/gp47 family protein [Clostridium botulinum]MCS4514029.1 baseplate J/gp47 family protein [Clostridium botulinum]
MFEDQTEEVILDRMMNKISNDLDKREGSIIYNALAPAAQEVAKMYSDMDYFLKCTFASPDMPPELLDLRVAEEGLKRGKATYAIKKGYFYNEENELIDIPLNSRFSIEDFNFIAVEKISTGLYKMQCETTGIEGNSITGPLIPIEYIEGLSIATLGELIIPGEDKEDNYSLFNRYVEHLNEKPYGGNIADYKINTRAIEGVGTVKVFPIWNGGGTVKIVFLDSDYSVPTIELIDKVQTILDPVPNQGKGFGVAPVGHVVTVLGAKDIEITIETKLLLKRGRTIGQVQQDIKKVLSEYLKQLRKQWHEDDTTIVRISQIEARILNVEGVADLFNTKINDKEENLTLGTEEVPMFKEVVLSEKEIN